MSTRQAHSGRLLFGHTLLWWVVTAIIAAVIVAAIWLGLQDVNSHGTKP